MFSELLASSRSGAASWKLAVKINITGPALTYPLLAPGASWPRYLLPALQKSGYTSSSVAMLMLRIKLISPLNDEGVIDNSGSDYDPKLIDWIQNYFSETLLKPCVKHVEVEQEWNSQQETSLEVSVYAKTC